jgi:hypothetical protein
MDEKEMIFQTLCSIVKGDAHIGRNALQIPLEIGEMGFGDAMNF